MDENKKKISFSGRLCAFSVALVFCITLSTIIIAFPPRVKADNLSTAIHAYDEVNRALFNLWVSSDGSPNQNAIAILAVEAAFLGYYINSSNTIVGDIQNGDVYYFGGFTYSNGNVNYPYFGSGYIASNRLVSRVELVYRPDEVDEDTSVYLSLVPGNDKSNISVYPASNIGAGTGYYIGSWLDGSSRLYTTVNNDPVYSGNTYLAIGEDNSAPSFTGFGNRAGISVHFNSGSIPSVNSFINSTAPTGDYNSDLQNIYDNLFDEFPDDVPIYWVNPFSIDPTESGSEDTTGSGNDDLFTLPPEWLESYNQPIPTFETISFSDVYPPTFDISTNSNGIGFWFVFGKKILETDSSGKLKNFFFIVFGLAVCGVVIWKLGSHGGDD